METVPQVLPRITGTEMEWNIRVQDEPDGSYVMMSGNEGDNRSHDLVEIVPEGVVSVEGMLSNGARYYRDLRRAEYATPEDRSFRGTVTRELAGERIVYAGMLAMQEKGDCRSFLINKRVADEGYNTWGYHASFCAPADKMRIDAEHLAVVGLHLATQNLFAGAGMVERRASGSRFLLAQKTINLNMDYAKNSHGSENPLLSMRTESHADVRWNRVHLTSMDANMSPWATWMRLGTTSLVLRLVEDGYRAEDCLMPALALFEFAKAVAQDATLQHTVGLTDGRSVRPLDVQDDLLEKAWALSARVQLPAEELEVLAEWQQAVDDLRSSPAKLVDRTDWVAKKYMLESFMDKKGYTLDDAEVRKKDRQFDLLGPLGIGERLRETTWKKWMPSETDIVAAVQQPPLDTRARPRSTLIRAAHSRTMYGSAAWSHVTSGTKVNLPDPYDASMPEESFAA